MAAGNKKQKAEGPIKERIRTRALEPLFYGAPHGVDTDCSAAGAGGGCPLAPTYRLRLIDGGHTYGGQVAIEAARLRLATRGSLHASVTDHPPTLADVASDASHHRRYGTANHMQHRVTEQRGTYTPTALP